MNKDATDALAKLAEGFEDLQAALADEQGAGTGDRIRGEQARQVSLAHTTDDCAAATRPFSAKSKMKKKHSNGLKLFRMSPRRSIRETARRPKNDLDA